MAAQFTDGEIREFLLDMADLAHKLQKAGCSFPKMSDAIDWKSLARQVKSVAPRELQCLDTKTQINGGDLTITLVLQNISQRHVQAGLVGINPYAPQQEEIGADIEFIELKPGRTEEFRVVVPKDLVYCINTIRICANTGVEPRYDLAEIHIYEEELSRLSSRGAPDIPPE